MHQRGKKVLQPALFTDFDAVPGDSLDTSSTFLDNLSLPLHRWFRYSAGFSALWVRELIEQEKAKGRRHILDPFAGSGTVLLEGELQELQDIGVESHPFVSRVARAKLCWREDPKAFAAHASGLLERARKSTAATTSNSKLLQKCFPADILTRLISLRDAWRTTADGSALTELSWLALVSILRECSPVGTAQWQYVLPKKRKVRALDPYEAFAAKVDLMTRDMTWRQKHRPGPQAQFYAEDARECPSVPAAWADLVITSPPYANNYDYADATRLEMTFLGEIDGWGDLQIAVRQHLIRSCTQHVAPLNQDVDALLGDPVLVPIAPDLAETCRHLAKERERHGGKKPYHAMIAAYFHDMARVWLALRKATARDALVCFVIGDSAPYGIYVPVDRWLGELAVAAGFKSFRFEKTRDRNVKWKNRKHRVPLHEGRLWIEG